ncbi:MAG: TrkH family potassium uptake protein [bacterium]|nr:TrkH family potassium uptake protein [bacterium]
MDKLRKSKFWGSSRLLIFSFLMIILIGAGLLMLPQMTNGDSLTFIDALFTATSATCVTGLVVVDTGSKFTQLGQIVILILIQVGGLGIMTFSTFFIYLVIGRFSISDRDVLQDTLTQSPIKNIADLLRTIFLFVLSIELIGACLLAHCFWNQFPFGKACYYGLFHSISAFCNAGFALFQNSFMDYVADWKLNVVIMMLIILGGIGFIVLNELKSYFFSGKQRQVRALSFHSKLALIITAVLIIAGALIIFIFENGNAFQQQPFHAKVLASLFQSVTSRTAGFNTVDISILTNSSLFFIIILMMIGASPGSCGGGIKTTTAGVIVAMLFARFQNRDDVNIFHRRIPDEIVSKAISVTFFSILITISFIILLMVSEVEGISHQESRGLFLEIFFEVVSAFGTVGLSTGTTSGLSVIGKIVIIITMFIGRVGPLTVAFSIGKKDTPRFRYAQEKVLIG